MRRWLSCVETSIVMLESMLMALRECMGARVLGKEMRKERCCWNLPAPET